MPRSEIRIFRVSAAVAALPQRSSSQAAARTRRRRRRPKVEWPPCAVSDSARATSLSSTSTRTRRTRNQQVSPRPYLGAVSAWYFGHSTEATAGASSASSSRCRTRSGTSSGRRRRPGAHPRVNEAGQESGNPEIVQAGRCPGSRYVSGARMGRQVAGRVARRRRLGRPEPPHRGLQPHQLQSRRSRQLLVSARVAARRGARRLPVELFLPGARVHTEIEGL